MERMAQDRDGRPKILAYPSRNTFTCVFCSANFGPTMITIKKFVLWNFFRDHPMHIVSRDVHNTVGTAFRRLRDQQVEFVILMDMHTKIKTKFIYDRRQTIEHHVGHNVGFHFMLQQS
jgi:hypothetical protein